MEWDPFYQEPTYTITITPQKTDVEAAAAIAATTTEAPTTAAIAADTTEAPTAAAIAAATTEAPTEADAMEHPGSINNNLSCRYLVPSLVRRPQFTTYTMLEDANLTKPNDVRGSKMRPKRCQRMQRRGKSTLTMVLRSQVKQYKSNSVKSNFLLRRKEKLESVIRVLKKFQLKYVGCQIGADLNEKIKNLSNECDYVSIRLNLILKSQGNKPIFYEWSGGSKKLM